MIVKRYVDVYPGQKPDDLFLTSSPLSNKIAGSKRFLVTFEIPDPVVDAHVSGQVEEAQ